MTTEWPVLELERFCSIASGGTPSRSIAEYWDGNVPWVKISDMLQGRIRATDESISTLGLQNSSAKLFKPGTLLLSIFATIGRTAILDIEASTNQAIVGIDPDSSVVDTDYLRYFLEFSAPVLASKGRGVAQANINTKILRAHKIPLPPLLEQKRIAAILDKVDALREKRRAAIAKLDELLQSVFLDMFGDPVTNPKGWESRHLSAVVKDGTIVTYGIVQAGEEYDGGVPYIRTSDIVGGELRLTQLRHTDPKIAAKFERSKVLEGEIVMSIRATVGTTALVPRELEGANLTQGTARIAPGREVTKDYLLYFIRSHGTQHWIQSQVKGATFREITLKRLREMPVLQPPLQLQQQFSEIVSRISTYIAHHNKSRHQLDDLFSSLQQRAFRGEL